MQFHYILFIYSRSLRKYNYFPRLGKEPSNPQKTG